MGLMRNYEDCSDCKLESYCEFIQKFIKDSELEYEIIGCQGLNIKIGNIWIIFNYCPKCGKKLTTWHKNGHWHLAETEKPKSSF